jgi:hypothetical protein
MAASPFDPDPAWAATPAGQAFVHILSDIEARPRVWKKAAALGGQRNDAGTAASGSAAWTEAWTQSLNTVHDNHSLRLDTVGTVFAAAAQVRGSTWGVARDAGIALLAWSNAPDILAADPTAVRMWAALGQSAAVLLLPACIALHTDRAKSHGFWSQIPG